MTNITTLLFDLGGVIVELGSLEDMMSSSPLSEQEIWRSWIRSPSVRRFESGACSAAEFSSAMIEEFSLSISPEEFIGQFNAWPQGTFKGASQLLMALSDRFQLACLSNSNQSHWDHFLRHQSVLEHFQARYFSHEIGHLKPDPAAFNYVLEDMNLTPGEILFFDDNETNVDSARSMGFQAVRVESPDGVSAALSGLGLLNQPHD